MLTKKAIAYYKKQVKPDGNLSVTATGDDIIVINGFFAAKMSRSAYPLFIQPATLQACPEPGETINFGTNRLDTQTAINIFNNNLDDKPDELTKTGVLIQTPRGDKSYEVFAAENYNVYINSNFSAMIDWNFIRKISGSGTFSAVIAESETEQFILLPVKLNPDIPARLAMAAKKAE